MRRETSNLTLTLTLTSFHPPAAAAVLLFIHIPQRVPLRKTRHGAFRLAPTFTGPNASYTVLHVNCTSVSRLVQVVVSRRSALSLTGFGVIGVSVVSNV